VVLYAIHWWRQKSNSEAPWPHGVWHLSKTLGIMCIISFILLFASFRFQTGKVLPPDPATGRHLLLSEMMLVHPHLGGPLRGLILDHPSAARKIDAFVDRVPLPAPDLFRLLYVFSMHAFNGHESYLLGKTSQTGWWYYFPVAFLVKTPSGDLLLLLLAVISAGRLLLSRHGEAVTHRMRKVRFEWFVLAVPPVIYFVTCLTSKIDIGLRHLLPIYPFLFMGIGAILFSRELSVNWAVRTICVIGITFVVAESAMAYPNYLSFFNTLSGGMHNGSKYLVDSNLDWGQDIKRLGRYLRARGNPPVCLAMLGDASTEYYNIITRPFPADLNQARQNACLVVISLTTLKESNADGQFDWLLRMTPVDRVGGSLLVYDTAPSPTHRR